MKIQLTDNLRIVKLDTLNWGYEVYRGIIDKKTKQVVRMDWSGDNGYFSTFEGATKAGITRVLDGDLEVFNSLEEYKEYTGKILNDILDNLKQIKYEFEKVGE